MTTTLKPALPGGTIRSQDAERDFLDWVLDRTPTRRLLLLEVQVGGIGGESQVKGKNTTTKYQVVNAVEVREPHELDQLRYRITQLRADQGLALKQPGLFAMSEAEQVDSLKDLIRDKASELEIPLAVLDERFVEYFGGRDYANAETVQACRAPEQLKEFAYVIGAIEDPIAGSTELDDESEVATS